VLRALLDHPRATVGGAWREALIRAAAARGETLTKNDARRRIAATDLATHTPSYLPELPGDVLARLPAAVAASLAGPGG
jgi:hypothetical protein